MDIARFVEAWRCKAAAGLAGLLMAGGPALAADWYTGDKTSEPDYARTIVLDVSGSVAGAQGDFGFVGATGAVDGDLAKSGYRARAEAFGGSYRYATTPTVDGPTVDVNARQAGAAALAGYAWVLPKWSFALYGGAEAIDTQLSYDDPRNGARGLRAGAKVEAEVYGEPSANTMASAFASYETGGGYYARFKAGLRVFDSVYAGPEFAAMGDEFYSEYRAGAHLSGLRLGALQLGVSGGVSENHASGAGAYVIVDAHFGF